MVTNGTTLAQPSSVKDAWLLKKTRQTPCFSPRLSSTAHPRNTAPDAVACSRQSELLVELHLFDHGHAGAEPLLAGQRREWALIAPHVYGHGFVGAEITEIERSGRAYGA